MGSWSRSWSRSWSLRRRIVALTAGTTLLAVVLLTVVLQVVLNRLAGNDVDRVVRDRATSVISSVRRSEAGTPNVPRSQLSAGVAIYAAGGTLVQGSAPDNLAEEYARLRLTDEQRNLTINDDNRIEARPFRRAGTSGVVIVSEPFAPYEEAERLALVVSLVTGLATVAAAAAVAAWATRRALRPVDAMARSAAEWSEHDLSRRFGSDADAPDSAPGRGPPAGPRSQADELGHLAETLDGLLDRVSTAIRSEQRLTSELAHELRTPLTSVRAEAELELLRDELPEQTRRALESIVDGSRRMSVTIATLLDLARSESTILARSRCTLADVVADVLAEVSSTPDVSLTCDVGDLRLAVPRPLAVRALTPVVENALRFAVGRVRITGRPDGGLVEIAIEDDGPGVAADRTAGVFEPGVTSGSSAGLGLAISRRIARSSGGDVEVAPDSRAGSSRFVVRLPSA